LQYTPDFGSRISGNIVFFNGALADKAMISRVLPVTAGKRYTFRLWARRVVAPAIVELSVGGEQIIVDLAGVDGWTQLEVVFTPTTTTATVKLRELTRQSFGSDVAISNVTFGLCNQDARVVPVGTIRHVGLNRCLGEGFQLYGCSDARVKTFDMLITDGDNKEPSTLFRLRSAGGECARFDTTTFLESGSCQFNATNLFFQAYRVGSRVQLRVQQTGIGLGLREGCLTAGGSTVFEAGCTGNDLTNTTATLWEFSDPAGFSGIPGSDGDLKQFTPVPTPQGFGAVWAYPVGGVGGPYAVCGATKINGAPIIVLAAHCFSAETNGFKDRPSNVELWFTPYASQPNRDNPNISAPFGTYRVNYSKTDKATLRGIHSEYYNDNTYDVAFFRLEEIPRRSLAQGGGIIGGPRLRSGTTATAMLGASLDFSFGGRDAPARASSSGYPVNQFFSARPNVCEGVTAKGSSKSIKIGCIATQGQSGGPFVDESSGAVIGVNRSLNQPTNQLVPTPALEAFIFDKKTKEAFNRVK
jgi:hypothetical protein